MQFCEQCGSTSRDSDGFCGGCGAKWPVVAPKDGDPGSHSPYDDIPAKITAYGLPEIRPKPVWLAVLLAVVSGPFGLYYSTPIGTIVMIVVAVILRYWLGYLGFLIVLPLCGLWAWKAARSSPSFSD